MTTTTIQVEIDEHTLQQATETLASIGLTVSEASRLFLARVASDRKLPFALPVPNARTRQAMEEARALSKARFGTAAELIESLEFRAKR